MVGLRPGVQVALTTFLVDPRVALSRECERQDGERRNGSEEWEVRNKACGKDGDGALRVASAGVTR